MVYSIHLYFQHATTEKQESFDYHVYWQNLHPVNVFFNFNLLTSDSLTIQLEQA